jgi:uncharacterized protein YndB with AHSA1/START domain
MRWVKRIALTLVAIVVLLLGIGLILPSTFKVQRSVDVAAPPDKIYPLIADPREWKKWSAWNARDPAMKIVYSGPSSGTGAKWTWQSASEGNGEMTFTSVVPNQRVDYSLYFPDFGMRSAGEVKLEPAGQGTRVTWTNQGDVGSSPINRYFAQAMDRLVGPDFEAGLKNLKAIAERT